MTTHKLKASNNYRPITCLPVEIRKKIYDSLINCGLFPEEQKGSRLGIRGKGKLLYNDQHFLKNNKTGQKNL